MKNLKPNYAAIYLSIEKNQIELREKLEKARKEEQEKNKLLKELWDSKQCRPSKKNKLLKKAIK